ncbi:hypothetical protein [Glycomyces paridis]|uniref:Uncharacterized protein n=1 Tax=Glycomyces paridis TaxID=2126555 RepID=A0A4S8P6S4_9ACTN|nr:hypothetical protein [Glycomyces paridis]THV25968.1 hypothetical protein E9998_19740 [Glycomyces paridis]
MITSNDSTGNVADTTTPIFYEPQHDPETRRRVAQAFARRGYELTSDEDAVLSILADGDGSVLTILWGDLGSTLHLVGEYASPEEYVTAAADWFESDLENDAPAEPGAAARTEEAERAANRSEWIAGMRALLDLLDADPEMPLPRAAKDAVAFYVATSDEADRIAEPLTEVEVHDRPERIFRYETTGRLNGLRVAVYTGAMTGVTL